MSHFEERKNEPMCVKTFTLIAGLSVLLASAPAFAELGINCRVRSASSGAIASGTQGRTTTVACEAGLVLTGGGQSCGVDPATTGLELFASASPRGEPSEWVCSWDNTGLTTANCKCDAICCTMTPGTGTAPLSCEHDECGTGIPLDDGPPACSECAATVCGCDPYCCETSWDTFCIHEAQELCGKTCNSQGSCVASCPCQ